MKRILTSIIITLVLATVVYAQSPLTGKWQGETQTMRFQIVLDLTATETALTGTFTQNGQTSTITDGKVSKNTFTFKARLNDQTEAITGELAGGQITIWLDPQASKPVILKRVITGKWQGKTRNGFQIELDLTATETALTGTFTREGQTTTIADGKVSKNTFTFKATINDQTEGFTGELTGDQITVWLDRQGPERAAVLKRIKT